MSIAFQIAALVAWGPILAWALLLIATVANRKRMFERLRKIGSFTPVIYSLNVLAVAVIFVSSATYVSY